MHWCHVLCPYCRFYTWKSKLFSFPLVFCDCFDPGLVLHLDFGLKIMLRICCLPCAPMTILNIPNALRTRPSDINSVHCNTCQSHTPNIHTCLSYYPNEVFLLTQCNQLLLCLCPKVTLVTKIILLGSFNFCKNKNSFPHKMSDIPILDLIKHLSYNFTDTLWMLFHFTSRFHMSFCVISFNPLYCPIHAHSSLSVYTCLGYVVPMRRNSDVQ